MTFKEIILAAVHSVSLKQKKHVTEGGEAALTQGYQEGTSLEKKSVENRSKSHQLATKTYMISYLKYTASR